MKNDLVSIITANYNCEKFIEETIESVLAQTYKNWEMIIVDDVSTDNSVNIIKKYLKQDNRIKLIQLNKNSGAAVARNKAIEVAKGRYIAFLDSDDLWKPNKLEKQICFMIENNYNFTYTSYELIDEKGHFLNSIKMVPKKLNYKELLKENQIGCLTAVYNQEKLGKYYMPLLRKRQDYGLWLNILKNVKYAYCVDEILSIYRIRTNSVSSNKLTLLKYNYELFHKHEKLSILKSLYYLVWNIYRKIKK